MSDAEPLDSRSSTSEGLERRLNSSLFTALATRFDIPWEQLEVGENELERLDEFREMLADRLRFIIDNQFGRLAQILYRIDVDERQVDEIFRHAPIPQVPAALADLIIARVLRTIETRRRYRMEN